ncbi:TrmH family RNA methyltransferase [Cellulosilyticum sp. I15G10I2]|uniref:TrmH family RNA methyltransferase n=1 Tax=Cellulosilyticum sp. I15G10I2 TaxID=1892843 RepID=UPI00085C9D32|nr:RNA methyltransferase [Cellulosilyticum sp. I15G10I2]
MQNNSVSSMQNPIIKSILQLQKKKTVRRKENLFIVEGIRSIQEIPANYQVRYLITTPELALPKTPALEEKKCLVVTEEVYKAISDTTTPQGAMAVVEMPVTKLTDQNFDKRGMYLLLENIQDPGNLGTIIRTAHAFGVKAIFITKGSVDLYSPKVVRATMGSLFHLPIYIDYEAEDYITHLKQAKIPLYVTALEEAQPIYDIRFEKKMTIVIGNEGNGVSETVKQMADYKMMIPMPGGSESLNASIAASICIYEVMRQMNINI